MRFLQSFVLPALFSLANAAAIERGDYANTSSTIYDAIIVGGGPSGLSALSGLARVRRNVLLIDSGEYRNGPTRHMHDVLGFDGVQPAWFRYSAREQLKHYDTVSWTNGTVTKIVADADNSANYTQFTVTSSGTDGAVTTYLTRKIVLATGLKDHVPETPGVEENWGKGIYWCPWCDGHEHADQALGILCPYDEVASMSREILNLNRDIICFVNGTETAEAHAEIDASFPDYHTYLKIHNITVVNSTITEITRLKDASAQVHDPSLPTAPEYDQFSISLANGESYERDAFFVSWTNEQRSSVGKDLGVAVYGGRLYADNANGLITNVLGVYAIGDANSDNSTNVPHAFYSGKRAAVYAHVRLERENALAEIAEAKATGNAAAEDVKRSMLDERSIWAEMNDPRDVTFAGEFEQ